MSGWFFAYGSLMWDPGVPVVQTCVARIEGYARSFCLRSIRHRGTPDLPGLVLGLEAAEGAFCSGLAFEVATDHWDTALAEIRERELSTAAYNEATLPVQLGNGRKVQAITYVMRKGHPQHVIDLSPDEQATIIARAQGGRGGNAEYLFNTVSRLQQLGLPDPHLDDLAQRVRRFLTP